MPTKPATVLVLGAMILVTTALVQTTRAAVPTIDLVHSTESREACEHAGGRYEEGPGYSHASMDGGAGRHPVPSESAAAIPARQRCRRDRLASFDAPGPGSGVSGSDDELPASNIRLPACLLALVDAEVSNRAQPARRLGLAAACQGLINRRRLGVRGGDPIPAS
jgi:hypothetical protein